jgi:hypothetical protein
MLSTNSTKLIQIISKNLTDVNEIEKAKKNITDEYILRNNSYTKMCPVMLKEIKKIQTKNQLESFILLSFSKCEYKYKNDKMLYKKRCCSNELCRYAHKEDELRTPLCILNLYNCCNNSEKCYFDHKQEEPPHIVLSVKKYTTQGKDIFKLFYYTNCVRIYYYDTGNTSVLHLSSEERNKIYDILVQKLNEKQLV